MVAVSDETGGDVPSAVVVEEKATTSYLSYLALGRSGTAAGGESQQQAPVSPLTARTARQEPSRTESVYNLNLASAPRPETPAAGRGGGGGKPSAHTRAATAIGHSRSATGVGTPLAQQTHVPPRRRKLSPRLYFALFVDHLDQFIVFLETVAARRWGQTVDEGGVKVAPPPPPPPVLPASPSLAAGLDAEEEELDESIEKADQIAVWNTLLELYLTLPADARGGGDGCHSQSPPGPISANANASAKPKPKPKPRPGPGPSALRASVLRKKAINVLKSDVIPYDPTHALVLCSGHGYTDGLVLLWERLGMYEDVIRFWMDKARLSGQQQQGDADADARDASARVVEHLARYGPSQPRLYPLVLRFLTSTSELLTRHQADVREILEYVDKQGILTPVGIIQVLSRNNVASVGLVKDWLGARIRDAKDEIQNVGVFGFLACLRLCLWCLHGGLGPRPHQVVSRRDGDKAPPGARSLESGTASRVPCHEVFGV